MTPFAPALSAALRTAWLGRELVCLRQTPSTNDVVMERARAGAAPGLVVIADEQSRGRGRFGRRWWSPPGGNLYLSALLPPPPSAALAPSLTLAAGVAVCDAVRALGCQAAIKWPNDVLIGGKKVAGILTETSTRGARPEAVVVGIGVDLEGELPAELAPIATTLALELGAPVDRVAFVADLLARFEEWIDRHRAEGAAPVARAWNQRSALLGRRVTAVVDGETVAGEAGELDSAVWQKLHDLGY